VELARGDEHADAGEHAVDDRRRHRAEPLPEPHRTRRELHQPGEEHDHAQSRGPVLLEQLPDDHAEPRRGAAHLERRPGQGADDEAADDAGDEPRAGGAPEAIATPMQSGSATRKTTTDASASVRNAPANAAPR
jgi:hypothetical protein